jgi:spermidine synthase
MTDEMEHCVPYVLSTPTAKSLHFSFAAIQSRMDLRQPELLELDYTRTMMGFLLFQPQPRAIAMIGLGGGSMARFIFKHLPDSTLKVVEINPAVLELREEFLIPGDGERFRVRLGDGADFVRSPPRLFDVLLVDGFDVGGQPPELASAEFYADCAAALLPDGVLAVNLCPAYAGFERQVDDLVAAFDGNLLLIPDRDCSNTIAFASRTPLAELFGRQGWAGPQQLGDGARRHLMKSFVRVARALA